MVVLNNKMFSFYRSVAWVITLWNLGVALAVESPSKSKQYRNDYEYNKMTDAFYKLHIESEDYDQAWKICNHEGSELMVPSSKHDVVQFHKMFKGYPDLGEWAWIGDDGLPHESEEEQPIIDLSNEEYPLDDLMKHHTSFAQNQRDAITRKGGVIALFEMNKLPFICKVKAKNAPFNSQCGVYGKDYEYNSTTGSCYKDSKIAMTWNEGFSQCQAEGAHLVVVNSQMEGYAIRALTKKAIMVRCSTNPWSALFYFVGFRAEKPVDDSPRVFKTIFDQTLEEAGYVKWAYNEPNNSKGLEYCGAIYKESDAFNDVNCAQKFPFICEKEVHTNSV